MSCLWSVLAVCVVFVYETTGKATLREKRSETAQINQAFFRRLNGSSVCYGDLGCFTTAPPFFSLQRPINFLPQSPSQVNTRFLLYTRANPTTFHILNANDLNSIRTSHYNGNNPTKIISHGFLENGFVAWMRDMKTELLKVGDFNVILVDWGGGSGLPYTQATANTRLVGAEVAKLILFLQVVIRELPLPNIHVWSETRKPCVRFRNFAINNSGETDEKFHYRWRYKQEVTDIEMNWLPTNGHARPEDTHVIGHSLGAHIAGYAGERTRNLGRISGLDPAEPYFQYTDPLVRLDPTDAQFVDVLHTDGVSILKLGYGMIQACGHVDYYPNSGETQPGCDKGPVETITMGSTLYNGAKQFVACNHLRAIDYFTESINSACPFRGYQCDSYDNFKNGLCMPCSGNNCGLMGYRADHVKPTHRQTHVKYYLDTGSSGPFCRFHYEVRVSFSSSSTEWRGMMHANIHGSNGQLGDKELTTDYTDLSPGKTYGFVITGTHDVGHITSVDFHWKHSSSLLNPLEWNVFNLRHPTLKIQKVTVYNGASNQLTNFCYNGNVENQKPVTMRSSC